MTNSKIEWTETTWNPITGCTKISSGCLNCYAERMAMRLKSMGQPHYAKGFQVTLHEDVLERPLHLKKPKRIFVNSMSDLFHDEVPDSFIFKVFDIMKRASWHQFQILTKRSNRFLELYNRLNWPQNVWIGVSIENNLLTHRIKDLRLIPAFIKFLSLEPLLTSIRDIDLEGIDWVIVGGESGVKARPIEESWVIDIRNQCNEQNVPFFFKQWGGVNKKKAGRLLEGRTWNEMPVMK